MTPYRRGDTIPALFAWCARRWPQSVALIDGSACLTYAELDAGSDEVAAELQSRGVGPKDFVAVALPRTMGTVTILLGILKTGAAYAAIDPTWPRERRTWLLNRIDPKLLLSTDTWDGTHIRGRRPAPVSIDGADPCAVFFTSGSTGEPKGVVLPHHGTARLFDDCDFADFGPGMALPQMFPLHWDGPILDLWGPLLCGGTSVLIDDVLQPDLLRTLIARDRVNGAVLPTAVFNMLVDEDIDALAGLRWVITGSEKVSPAHLARVLRRHPHLALSNGYGPVESSALVTVHRVSIEDTDDPDGVPIGRPLCNSTVFALDEQRVCAPGETGEICLGGDGIALEYLGAPELTARKLVTVDVEGGPVRVYRTGDLGWIDSGGVLHFAGRNDRQVKIRGHRVEPGEIERSVEDIDGVGRCAVVDLPAPDGTAKALALFYVPTDDDLTPADVRAALAERLPSYLVPRDIRPLDELPLTRNGKVDRPALTARALASPRAEPTDAASAPVRSGRDRSGDRPSPPQSDAAPKDGADAEGVIARAFADLLPAGACGPDDDFFACGGSSLDAARLCARLGIALRVSVPVSQIYRTPTIASLTTWLDRRGADLPAGSAAVAVGPVALTSGQVSYLAAPPGFICLLAWSITGAVDIEALAAAVTDVHGRHESLHAHYHHGEPPYATLPSVRGRADHWCLPDTAGHDEALAALREHLSAPLDIASGHVWRSAVVTFDGGTLFGVGVHHIAFDGWSEAVFAGDLSTAYAARAAGCAPTFAAPAPTLAECLADQHRRSAGIDLDGQLRYWIETLRDLPKLTLPGVVPGLAPASGPTRSVVVALEPEVLDQWEQRPGDRMAALVATFAHTLRGLTGRRDVGILLPVALRGSTVLDAAVLSHMDTVILRLRPTGADPITAARSEISAALAAADIPFRDVMTAMAMVRPDLHVLLNLPTFVVQDHDRRLLELPGCAVTIVADNVAQDQAVPLAVEVRPEADGGATIRVTVRRDRVPADLAEHVADAYRETLVAGPDALVPTLVASGSAVRP